MNLHSTDDTHQESRCFWISFVLILLMLPLGGACFLAGGLSAEGALYEQLTQKKIDALRSLRKDPKFAHLEIDHSSAAQVYFGEAEISESDFNALQHEVTHLLGRDEAENVLYLLQWGVNERAGRELHDDGETGSPLE